MATNQSNKEKTMDRVISAKSSDTWSIDNLITYYNYKNMVVLPNNLVLDRYRDYFEQEGFLVTMKLDEKFWYSPEAFSEYLYGTPDLDFLVLYFSKKSSIFEFKGDTIRVLSPERLKDVNKVMVKFKDEIRNNKDNPPLYAAIPEITSTTNK